MSLTDFFNPWVAFYLSTSYININKSIQKKQLPNMLRHSDRIRGLSLMSLKQPVTNRPQRFPCSKVYFHKIHYSYIHKYERSSVLSLHSDYIWGLSLTHVRIQPVTNRPQRGPMFKCWRRWRRRGCRLPFCVFDKVI